MSAMLSECFLDSPTMLTDIGVNLIRGGVVLECYLERRHSARGADGSLVLMNDRLSCSRLRLLRYRYFSISRRGTRLLRHSLLTGTPSLNTLESLLESRQKRVGRGHDEPVSAFALWGEEAADRKEQQHCKLEEATLPI